MLRIVFSSHRDRFFQTMLLLVAVLVVSTSFGLFLSISETVVAQVNEDLARYWRTAYDILVRPPGYRLEPERGYNLVSPNHLLGIPGGITFDQYEAIRNIPGVEIAAPVAVIGKFVHSVTIVITDSLPSGLFGTFWVVEEDNGAHIFRHSYEPLFNYVGPEALSEEERRPFGAGTATCYFDIPGLMVGIDPKAENTLVGLDQTLVEGEHLRSGPLVPLRLEDIQQGLVVPGFAETDFYSVPVWVNATPYISFTLSAEVVQLEIPPDDGNIRGVLEKGGLDFLTSLPRRQVVTRKTVNRAEAYQALIRSMPLGVAIVWLNPPAIRTSSVQYRLVTSPLIQESGPVLEAIPTQLGFREEVPFSGSFHPFAYFVVGIFDVERLGLPEELAAVPLETYFPPKGTLRYDENGNPVEPRTLRPTTDPYGYFQSPPLLLTTIEAARAIAGEDCISAIRVRVAGIDRFSPEAQSRIEAVAAEIINRTGLDVDVVVGSSPRPILVHIPGLGYVEEYWVQKGVTLTTHREVRRANLLLFGVMLGVCALFIFNTTAAGVSGRVREFGLLKAVGWRGRTVAGVVLLEGFLIGVAGGGVGMGVAVVLARLLGLAFPVERALWILPTGILLCLAGFAVPALRAARVSPVVALRQGEQSWRGKAPRWLGIAGRSFLRRRMRTLLTVGVMGAGAGMLALLVSLLAGMRGYLALTLLGRYILMRVSGYHWGMVGVMMGVGGLAAADVLLAGVLERRREIGVLKAVGWRTRAVAVLFLLEGAVLGLAGGVVGTALGLGVYLALYRSVAAGLVWAVLAGLGVPVMVGVLAAAYPARVAAKVLPAEAVREE